ncbi:MAG TPA: Flp pilus assembly protein CpaB, partial [Holophaga sp.]|nr:Flp pilus assembly protein CpaB [Holophaga sp.]
HQNRKLTKIVLENVLVLASGSALVQPAAKGGREDAAFDTYTLEVTPEEAEKLSLAGHTGELNLALRGSLDTATIMTPGADVTRNLASFREEPAPAKGKESPRVAVEEIRGTKREQNTLGEKPLEKK